MTQEMQTYTPMGDDDEAFRFGPLVDVPDGEHPATVVDLGRMLVNWDGEDRTRVRWDFGVLDAWGEDSSPAIVSGWTSTSTGEKSTARRWIAALKGPLAIAAGSVLRKSDLIGLPCRIVVIHDDKGYPKVDLVLAPAAPVKAVSKGNGNG